MNGTYFSSPTFLGNNANIEEKKEKKKDNIDKILINNIGKSITIYCSFENNKEEKEFIGRLEFINDNYVSISNVENGSYYFIPIKFINYFIFKEKVTLN